MREIESDVVSYKVRLQAWFRREGRDWLAWCPAIDVMTQARTKSSAAVNLREAVQLWFESCIDRKVLGDALSEVGFTLVPSGESNDSANSIKVVHRRRPVSKSTRRDLVSAAGRKRISFSAGHAKGTDYIEGTIPAHIAAQQLGNTARAST